MSKVKAAEPDLLAEAAQIPEEPSAPKPKRGRPAKIANLPAEAPKPGGVMNLLAAAIEKSGAATELFELYLKTEAKQQFHDALLGVDLPSIDRDGKIKMSDGKHLRFASFENVHKAVVPLLRQHGFRLSFQPMPGANGEGLVVECKLIRGIYEEKCIVPISTAPASRAMNSQQAIGAAIKYASRYGILALLNLRSEAPEDRDTDAVASDATITGSQAKKLMKAIDESGLSGARFMDKYKIEAVHLLPASQYDEAMKALADYKERASAVEK